MKKSPRHVPEHFVRFFSFLQRRKERRKRKKRGERRKKGRKERALAAYSLCRVSFTGVTLCNEEEKITKRSEKKREGMVRGCKKKNSVSESAVECLELSFISKSVTSVINTDRSTCLTASLERKSAYIILFFIVVG